MTMRDVTAVLRLNVSPFVAGTKEASAATRKLSGDITRDMSKGSRSAGILGSSFGTVGIVAGLAGAALIKSAADFEQSMSNVKATGADAVANIDALQAAAIAAGNATKYSATEAADGIEALAKAGVSSADVLGGGLKGALSLAAAGNLDVAGSAEAAASAMNQFGLAGKDVPHIADLLAAGAGKAQGEVSDMAQALNQAGLIAHGAGASIEETTGTLAAFASAGLIGSDAGTSFKTMLQRLQAPTAETKILMDHLGISAYDANGNFVGLAAVAGQLQKAFKDQSQEARSAALATIFGSDAVRAANVLYEQGEGGIKKWTRAVDDSGYAADVAKTKMDNLKGDLETLKGTIDTLLISGGEQGQGPLRSLTQALNDALLAAQKYSKWAAQFDPGALHQRQKDTDVAERVGTTEGVVRKIRVLGADAAVKDILKVAVAADLTPREIQIVLKQLGWNTDEINPVVEALQNVQDKESLQANLTLAGFDPTKIAAINEALKGTQDRDDITVRLTKAGFEPTEIQVILGLLGDVERSHPKPTVDVNDLASDKLRDVLGEVLGIPTDRTITIKAEIKDALDKIDTVLRAVSSIGGIGAAIKLSTKKATGGAIVGPGTATSDSIPAWLSNGEHVLTASDVQKVGGQSAAYRMRSAIQAGELKFANGGAAEYRPAAAYMPVSSAGSSHVFLSIRDVSFDFDSSKASMQIIATDAAGRLLANEVMSAKSAVVGAIR